MASGFDDVAKLGPVDATREIAGIDHDKGHRTPGKTESPETFSSIPTMEQKRNNFS